jgi:hypothetical protein
MPDLLINFCGFCVNKFYAAPLTAFRASMIMRNRAIDDKISIWMDLAKDCASPLLMKRCLGLRKVKVIDFCCDMYKRDIQTKKQQAQAVKVSSRRGYIN